MKHIKFSIKRHKISLMLILSFLFCFNKTNGQSSQYKENIEIGVLGGTSYYLGDLNTKHFSELTPMGSLVYRKNIDRRITYKGSALFTSIKADERNSNDTIASDRGLHFNTPIYEISGQLEFNFKPYDPGHPLYKWTPFVYTGLSMLYFNPTAENKNGEWVDLQPLGTEGQGTSAFPERDKYSLVQFAIPMGGGVKIAVNEFFTFMIEYGVKKTFTDYLDDVSTTYPGKNIGAVNPYPIGMSNAAIEMSDPNGTHVLEDQRGDPEKNDWFAFTGITLSFRINNNSMDCDY